MQTDKAIDFYKKTIKMGRDEEYYFAAKSALQLAYIYEKVKDYDNAKIYFNSCLDMENHLYEQGIEQKAKAGLNRLP
jgi:tetratricopeptide (TPR) repeat protein